MFFGLPFFVNYGPFTTSCTKTKVVIKDSIFDLYPEYKESYYNLA